VLELIKAANLRLKCEFGTDKIEFLGFTIANGQKTPSDDKRQVLANFPVPANKRMLQGFLGLANFIRHLVPDFAQLAQPLFAASSARRFSWTPKCQHSFELLKEKLSATSPVYLPDLSIPFIVTCDASEIGMGAMLWQVVDGERRVVEFMSRNFNDTERRYSTIEREATAIWWALDKWQHFLKGTECTIETDHKPLRWLLSMSNTTPKLSRMAQKIKAEYRIKGIEYVKGEENLLADTLSRIEIGLIDDNPGAPSDRLVALTNQQPARFKLFNNRVYLVENQLKRLCLDSPDEQEAVLKEIHDEAGHLGRYKCQEAIRQRFYWPHWRRNLKDHLRRCSNCAMAKNDLEPHKEELLVQESSDVWERVHIDLCGPLTPSDGNRYIVVLQDTHGSKPRQSKA